MDSFLCGMAPINLPKKNARPDEKIFRGELLRQQEQDTRIGKNHLISNEKRLNTQQDDDILPAAIRKTIQENHPHEKNHRQHGQQ